ncbi:Transglutaminase superfamily protein [Paraburkholderia tropica]|nr:Transglutaminase superfamily protein [Paraburkholderia tropica]
MLSVARRRGGVALASILALCAAWPLSADAQQSPAPPPPLDSATDDQPPATLERDVHVFIVQKDGSVEEHDDSTLRANTGAGVDAIAQRYVWFNKDIETITGLTAQTIDPDGATHTVGPANIRDVQEPRSAGAPTFEDGVLRTVIFPGVQPGSRVRLAFSKRRTKPLQAGTFSYFAVPEDQPTQFQRLVFDLPADVPLYADARGYTAQAPVTENGRTRYAFDHEHGPYPPQEAGAVARVNWGARLMVTTVPGFAAFAARYRESAADPSATSPAIAAFAQSLTAGASDPREKAARLYDWMRLNIRYVALFLGETEAAPHRVTDILRDRYGDCKDHVALFTALLAAVGVRAEAALINLGPVYSLPDVPGYGAEAINHVIAYLPDLGVFADTSSGGVAFGFLPAGVMDRPALLVDDGVLARTPATQPRARSARLDIDVNADGNAAYRYHVEDAGASAEPERNTFRRATHQVAQQIAAQRVRLTGLAGTAHISTSALDATSGSFGTSIDGTLDHFVWRDGTTALPALSSLSGGIATQIDTWLAVPRRTQPWACVGGDYEEDAQIVLPAFARVTDLPRDASVSVQADAARLVYSARYVFDPLTRTVQIARRLSAQFGQQVCSAQQFEQMRDALVRIQRDTHAQIVVRAR